MMTIKNYTACFVLKTVPNQELQGRIQGKVGISTSFAPLFQDSNVNLNSNPTWPITTGFTLPSIGVAIRT